MPLTRIQSAALEPNALTSVSIADNAVTTAKIAANAVVTADIADGNVTSIKMSTTGVAASTYGGTSNIPRIVIDSAGRITNAANVSLDTINGDLNVTGNVSITNKLTAIGTSGIAGLKIADVLETANASATAATGNVNFDVTTQAVLYYTTNASGNWTINLRGSSGTSLNNLMANGESLTAVFLATQGSTAYYNSAVQIDGTGVTPKWQGGAVPTAGNANSVDVYSYTVFKTNNATYTVFASQTRFA